MTQPLNTDAALQRVKELADHARTTDHLLHAAVHAARAEHASWPRIGRALGVSRQAATMRFSR